MKKENIKLIYDLYFNNSKSRGAGSAIRNNNKLSILKSQIEEETKWISKYRYSSLKERVYLLFNNINEKDLLCKCGSGNILSWRNGKRNIWHSKGCSPTCEMVLINQKSKREETILSAYGVKNTYQREDIKEKIRQQNLDKYGLENPGKFQSECFKKGMIKKYGVDNPMKIPGYVDNCLTKRKITWESTYGTDNPMKSLEMKNKMKQKFINTFIKELGINITDYNNYQNKYSIYRKKIGKLTRRSYSLFNEYINPNKLKRSTFNYHLDHKYSVAQGFRDKIPFYIIASPINLEMISFKENLKKNKKCSITLEQLYVDFNNWMEKSNKSPLTSLKSKLKDIQSKVSKTD
jgi:hypothetical protein